MRKLTAGEVARMVTSQGESLNDTCTLYRATASQDSDTGEVKLSYDSGTALACGLSVEPEYRNERGEIITIDADAILRLPSTQGISIADKVIARAKTYAVDGVQPGRHLTIAALQEVKI